ncbi:MAG TPA: hypothetical protein VFC63_11105 [Blastocatellia bacterium]|nr:hypothetical protein [Blastocatellia bacterium]
MYDDHQPKSLADVYAHLPPKERQEAIYYFTRYVDLVRRIFDRNHEKLGDLTKKRGRP